MIFAPTAITSKMPIIPIGTGIVPNARPSWTIFIFTALYPEAYCQTTEQPGPLPMIRQLTQNGNEDKADARPESLEMMMQRLTGINIRTCPKCGKGRLARLYKLLPEYVDYILPSRKEVAWNTS